MKKALILSFLLPLDLFHNNKNKIKRFTFCLLLGGHFSCFGAQVSLEKQLDLAIRKGNISEVQVLLTRPAIDVNVQDKKGRTALIYAARTNSPELVRLLLAHPDIDVNVQADVNLEAREGSTALMAAVSKSSKLVELFLNHSKTDVNVQDRGGSTALMYATRTNSPESVRLLLARPDIEVNVATATIGYTALMSYRSPELVRLLLLAHPHIDVSMQTLFGTTALTYAAKSNSPELVRRLLDHPSKKEGLKEGWKILENYAQPCEISTLVAQSMHSHICKAIKDSGNDLPTDLNNEIFEFATGIKAPK